MYDVFYYSDVVTSPVSSQFSLSTFQSDVKGKKNRDYKLFVIQTIRRFAGNGGNVYAERRSRDTDSETSKSMKNSKKKPLTGASRLAVAGADRTVAT